MIGGYLLSGKTGWPTVEVPQKGGQESVLLRRLKVESRRAYCCGASKGKTGERTVVAPQSG